MQGLADGLQTRPSSASTRALGQRAQNVQCEQSPGRHARELGHMGLKLVEQLLDTGTLSRFAALAPEADKGA